PTPPAGAPATQAAPQTPAQPPAQTPARPAGNTLPLCGGLYQIGPPSRLPPADSGPVVYQVGPCFEKQGGSPVVDAQTYLYYMEVKNHVSVPSSNRWVPYDDKIEQVMLGDFKRLWATNFLDDLSVETHDYVFSNGVVGKVILYNMEERQRVKIVDYVGSKKIETAKIDEKLKDANAQIRLDTFIDPALVRKVQGIVQDMLREKGFQFATVTPEIQPIEGGPKLVHLTFHMDEGPRVEIRSIDFVGNKAFADSTLKGQLKDTKENGGFHDFAHLWTWISSAMGDRTYKEAKFD